MEGSVRISGEMSEQQQQQQNQAVKLTKDTECCWESAQDTRRLKMAAD